MKVRLLLSTQRSGSNFLKSFIEHRFPAVACTDEILREPIPALTKKHSALPRHPSVPHFWPWYQREAATGAISVAPDQRIAALHTYIQKLADLAQPRDLLLDIKYDSIRALSGYRDTDYGSHDFVSYLLAHKIPVLHLVRKNVLKLIVSQKLSEQSPRNGESAPRIRLEPKQVLHHIRYLLKLTEDYQNRFSGYEGYTEVVYEEFVQEQRQPEIGPVVSALSRFLEKEPLTTPATEIPSKKITSDNIAEVVENWDEIYQALQLTKFSWMTQAPLKAAA